MTKRILIVEDDNFYACRLKEDLIDLGVESTIVHNTEEALSTDISTYEAAIIDMMLPNEPEVTDITHEETRAGFLSGVAIARRFRAKNQLFKIILFSGYIGDNEGKNWAMINNIPYFSKADGRKAFKQCLQHVGIISHITPRAFIVHGHDEVTLLELKDYIHNNLKWQAPVVLREQPSSGKTVIEKFEEYASGVDYVFVLMTPDDLIADITEKRRSRQNVIFELGFFYGQFDRKSGKILVLHKGPLELPSDIDGVVWIDISNGIKSAGEDIRRELRIR